MSAAAADGYRPPMSEHESEHESEHDSETENQAAAVDPADDPTGGAADGPTGGPGTRLAGAADTPQASQPASEAEEGSVPDEALPDDLVPGEDNPLAQGLPAGETVEGMLEDVDEQQAGQD